MSMITIQNGRLTVAVSTLGAEIQSIRDEAGVERLWQGDPDVWTGRAPILFPVAGGFRGDGYELDGQWYDMPKHGFARNAEWTAERAETDKAVMLLQRRDPGFPFDYALRAIFKLCENRLQVDYAVQNTGNKTFWFSVGGHEAFQTPGDMEDYSLVFDRDEVFARYELDGNLILREPNVIGEGKVLPLNEQMLKRSAIVFRGLKSDSVTLQSRAHSRKVRVIFAGNGTLMFWHKPNAKYLCIEPWNNSPDFVDAERDIAKKPDFICLLPGSCKTVSHTIVIE